MATPSSPAFVRRDAKNSSILKLTACAKVFTDPTDELSILITQQLYTVIQKIYQIIKYISRHSLINIHCHSERVGNKYLLIVVTQIF